MQPLGQRQLQVYEQPPQQMRQTAQGFPEQQLQPFGPPHNGLFGMLDDMMMGPMGGLDRGAGPFGGGLFDGLFGQMDQMMRQMDAADQMMPMGGNGSQFMMMSSNGGSGSYSTQTMMMSSTIGRDGQVHTERYSSSAVGDQGRQISETQQAYSNSTTGVDKMSLERQFADQGRKMVKERNRLSGEERSTEMFRGITEDQASSFDQRWQGQAAPHLPQHSVQQLMLGGGDSAGLPNRRAFAGQPPAALTYGPDPMQQQAHHRALGERDAALLGGAPRQQGPAVHSQAPIAYSRGPMQQQTHYRVPSDGEVPALPPQAAPPVRGGLHAGAARPATLSAHAPGMQAGAAPVRLHPGFVRPAEPGPGHAHAAQATHYTYGTRW